MNTFTYVDNSPTYKPTWPKEVNVGDKCFYWDEWVQVVKKNGVKVLRNGPTVEEAVGLGATFKRKEDEWKLDW